MIITPIGYDEQGPFGVMCTPHLAETQIDRIEQSGAPARSRKHHSGLQLLHTAGEAAGQLGSIVEAHQEELIERIRRAHELHRGLARFVHLVGHAAAHIKNQSNRNRDVLARQGYDFLLGPIFVNTEIFSFQAGDQTVQGVGHRDVYECQVHVDFNAFSQFFFSGCFWFGRLNGALGLGERPSHNQSEPGKNYDL